MKKIYLMAAVAMMSAAAYGQDNVNLDTYMGAQLATEDLNGTARYVGMGGALEALGAEISTISTNPAGIGMFRKSQVAGSMGLIIQEEGKNFQDGSKVNASFDQLGVVIALRTGVQSYINFGFNYHKSRNFNYVLSAAGAALNGSSQNRQTIIKGRLGLLNAKNSWYESQVDNLLLESGMLDNGKDAEGNKQYSYIDSKNYEFDRAHTGYIGEYDINISGNINDRVYLGATLGIKDVRYYAYSEYFEVLNPQTPGKARSALMYDDHRITGTGFDIKFGTVIRPIEESPFRFGLYVHTPTWYSLRSKNNTRLGNVQEIAYNVRFRFNTPWKFGVSLGHIIDNQFALGLTYEYADYTSNDMRSITDRYYDWDNYYHENSSSDQEMKRNANDVLRGVHTLKLGAEMRADKMLSIRIGYNYVSPMYQTSGVRDQTLNSPGVYMASTTDYTNWYDTHRLTAGVGFTFDNLRLDLAYQYSMRKGDFYPYMSRLGVGETTKSDGTKLPAVTNVCSAVSVKDNRHQLLFTANYTF